jgi:MFS transporter, AAHS family, 4-hydroxybenzoate transporter
MPDSTVAGSIEPISIDVGRLIDERPMSGAQWLVAITCALSMFMGGYAIQVMALVVPDLSQAWGVDAPKFGLALSAVSIGLGAAAALIAPLGDWFGRRTLLTAALVLIGVSMIASTFATSPMELVFWRALTGIGIGAGVPNCNAWTSEYSPARGRATLMVVMNAAVGIGASFSSLIAPAILARWGWQGTFIVCGVGALVLAGIVFVAAPESLKFLLSRRPTDPKIGAILRRIAPDVDAARIERPAQSQRMTRPQVGELLSPVFRTRTLVLWGVVFGNLFTMYVLISWLTTLLRSSGWSADDAVRGASLIPIGGILGGVILSLFMNRGLTRPALMIAFVIASVCLGLFTFVPSGAAWTAMLLLVGAGIQGGQLALNALSTAYYPPRIKATGMAYVGAVGTIGSFISPNAVGWAIGNGFTPVQVLTSLSIPPILCLGGVLLMRREWQNN